MGRYMATSRTRSFVSMSMRQDIDCVEGTRVRDLQLFAETNGWSDAAVALAEIRHGYVYPF